MNDFPMESDPTTAYMRTAAYAALGRAVERLHIPPEGPDTCDVDSAWAQGYYLLAADILVGATDIDDVRFADAYDAVYTSARVEAERREFGAVTPSYVCACGATVWRHEEYGRARCHNCQELQPEETDDEIE